MNKEILMVITTRKEQLDITSLIITITKVIQTVIPNTTIIHNNKNIIQIIITIIKMDIKIMIITIITRIRIHIVIMIIISSSNKTQGEIEYNRLKEIISDSNKLIRIIM